MAKVRMTWMWAIVVVTTVAISFFYPQQLGMLLFKVNNLALGAVGGYWLDRMTFPYARPGLSKDGTYAPHATSEVAFMFRRAILMAAGVLGVALAL